MHIISASRRTDIPAFYMTWFMHRLRTGSISYPNPYNGRVHTVSLDPVDVHSIVFWSKFYRPLLRYCDELEQRGYSFVCHYTITGLPRQLEPHVPRWQRAASVLHTLADRIGPRRVFWRFDPIVLTDELTPDFYVRRFREIAAHLESSTERCTFSFATYYGKVQRRMQRHHIHYQEPPIGIRQDIAGTLVEIATRHGLTLYACCQETPLHPAIQPAHCIDGTLLAELFPDRPAITRANPTRTACGCTTSKDVGVYDTCGYGCAYCYANQNHERARQYLKAHQPTDSSLGAAANRARSDQDT